MIFCSFKLEALYSLHILYFLHWIFSNAIINRFFQNIHFLFVCFLDTEIQLVSSLIKYPGDLHKVTYQFQQYAVSFMRCPKHIIISCRNNGSFKSFFPVHLFLALLQWVRPQLQYYREEGTASSLSCISNLKRIVLAFYHKVCLLYLFLQIFLKKSVLRSSFSHFLRLCL